MKSIVLSGEELHFIDENVVKLFKIYFKVTFNFDYIRFKLSILFGNLSFDAKLRKCYFHKNVRYFFVPVYKNLFIKLDLAEQYVKESQIVSH